MLGLSAKSARNAGIAQLVEHHLAKVEVASSSLVSRSNTAGAMRYRAKGSRDGLLQLSVLVKTRSGLLNW